MKMIMILSALLLFSGCSQKECCIKYPKLVVVKRVPKVIVKLDNKGRIVNGTSVVGALKKFRAVENFYMKEIFQYNNQYSNKEKCK